MKIIVVKMWIVSCIDFSVSYIVLYKIHKHLIKFIKNYRWAYVRSIFIIDFECIQPITDLFITYVIIFNKLTKLNELYPKYSVNVWNEKEKGNIYHSVKWVIWLIFEIPQYGEANINCVPLISMAQTYDWPKAYANHMRE